MSTTFPPYASIVIPVRNGMPLVERCLNGILAQTTPWPFEVIAIDSSSTDGTWELLESLPVTRIRIAPCDFNHGATRNLGASHARGEYLVFFVQDAVPADESWLFNLVSAAELVGAAGAYSRQVPRPDSRLVTKYMTIGTTPCDEIRERKALQGGVRLAELPRAEQFRLAVFQDASSCIRRSIFDRHPFSVLPYGEDMEWGKRAIEAGYALVYEPTSVVYHSHDRSPLYALKRAYADHYQCAELFDYVMLQSVAAAGRSAVWQTLDAWRYIFRQRARVRDQLIEGAMAPVYLGAVAIGQYLGPRMFRSALRRPWMASLNQKLRAGV